MIANLLSTYLPHLSAIIITTYLLYFVYGKHGILILQVLFFLRFPILFGLAFLVLPVMAIVAFSNMLGNIFIFGQVYDIALVAWMAVMLAWIVMYTGGLITSSFPKAYGLPDLNAQLQARYPRLRSFRIWTVTLLALPTLLIVASNAETVGPVGGIVGVAMGIAVAWLSYIFLRRLYSPYLMLLDRLRDRFDKWPSLRRSLFDWWLPWDYVARRGNYFRHDVAFNLFVLTLLLNIAGIILFAPDRWSVDSWQPPVAAFLFLRIQLLAWILPALSFVFDRHRIPVIFPVIVVAFMWIYIYDTDHYYEAVAIPPHEPQVGIEGGLTVEVPSIDEMASMRRTNQEQDKPVVVIMASGGGIRAALWTAQVLTGLQRELGDDFADSIYLISSVSGGSVGAMYYVESFTPSGPPQPDQLDYIVDLAGQSTLGPVAWGFIYPDLGLANTGRIQFVDRGWALETAWDNRLIKLAQFQSQLSKTATDEGNTDFSNETKKPTTRRMMLDWAQGVEEGWRPAVIFNATEVETGARFIFSSIDMPSSPTSHSFHQLFPLHDVSVATAARMGATFPYVSPVAKAATIHGEIAFQPDDWTLKPGMVRNPHLADGGYFDNDGIASALEWLELTLNSKTLTPRRLVLIQIVSELRLNDAESCGRASPGERAIIPPGGESIGFPGWISQVAGPFFTVLMIGVGGQRERGQKDLERFIGVQAQVNPDINILHCMFDLKDSRTLSWQLSQAEAAAIRRYWDSDEVQIHVEEIREFMGLGD